MTDFEIRMRFVPLEKMTEDESREFINKFIPVVSYDMRQYIDEYPHMGYGVACIENNNIRETMDNLDKILDKFSIGLKKIPLKEAIYANRP